MYPMPSRQRHESRVRIPFSWEALDGTAIPETDFLEMVRQIPMPRVLPSLISLLQYGDASEPPAYEILDQRVRDLFPTETASRIADELERNDDLMFFSKWQLLLAIKLTCVFGSRDNGEENADYSQFLKLLLMVNGFYPDGDDAPNTPEGDMLAVQETALRGYSLIQNEHPHCLIGRYAELFSNLPIPENQAEFNAWVDIQDVWETELGIQLDAFKAVLFALYAKSAIGTSWPDDQRPGPQLGRLYPETYFSDTLLSVEERTGALGLATTAPDDIRDQHLAKYGETLGNPTDLSVLLRKPVIKLHDGSLAGVSGQLLVQRYTCGLYWDIHDALPDDPSTVPNRRTFQTFFGELHERYGRDVLQRIADRQTQSQRQLRLLSEQDYPAGEGSNPDSMLLETIGSRNTRSTLFEFKVGRPRYIASFVEGNVQAFQEDLHKKIEDGVEQEIDFYQKIMSGQRAIPGLTAQNIRKWFFIIVVTDPFPAMSIFLEPLQQRLATLPVARDTKLYGPFILSLSELEQLETLPEKRVSELLIEWATGPERGWPFHSFYAYRTKGRSIRNQHIARLADQDMDSGSITLFGRSVRQP